MGTRDKIIKILEEIRPDIDFEIEDKLVDDGLLESFDIVALVSEITDEFEVDVRPKDLKPSNFNCIDAMVALVEELLDE